MGIGLTVKGVESRIKGGAGKFHDGKGLYLVVPKSGDAYWMLRYSINSKRREMTLRKASELSLADARTVAEAKKREAREGVDPLATRKREKQKNINTVDSLFEDWLVELKSRLKHPNIPERLYVRDIRPLIGELPLGEVNARDIRAVIQRVVASNRPTIANDVLLYCKQLFNHAIKLDFIDTNPASAFSVKDAGGIEESRERKLSIDELTKVFKVFRDNRGSFTRDNYLACALLIVLGVRKSELIEAPWSEFDLDNGLWSLPVADGRSKSGAAIDIPLPVQAIEWLKELQLRGTGSPFVFPCRRASSKPYMGSDTLNRAITSLFGISTGKRKQPPNVMSDIEYFTVHDFRRTCRSMLAAAGVSGHVAERCLNHKLKGVVGIYDRHDYLKERREALQKIADMVAPIVNNLTNVMPFNRNRA